MFIDVDVDERSSPSRYDSGSGIDGIGECNNQNDRVSDYEIMSVFTEGESQPAEKEVSLSLSLSLLHIM